MTQLSFPPLRSPPRDFPQNAGAPLCHHKGSFTDLALILPPPSLEHFLNPLSQILSAIKPHNPRPLLGSLVLNGLLCLCEACPVLSLRPSSINHGVEGTSSSQPRPHPVLAPHHERCLFTQLTRRCLMFRGSTIGPLRLRLHVRSAAALGPAGPQRAAKVSDPSCQSQNAAKKHPRAIRWSDGGVISPPAYMCHTL